MTESPERPGRPSGAEAVDAMAHRQRFRPSLGAKIRYAARILPRYAWQRMVRRNMVRRNAGGAVHLIIALADHFEPAIIPSDGRKRAPLDEQERRLEQWCREYPRLANEWRDNGGFAFQHTYFYPAEQFHASLLDRLAEHCREGWGETEVHLHHGVEAPDTAENTRRVLTSFRDELEKRGCVSYWDGAGAARYAFVHGNFALANSAGGRACGVDAEMQVLAETGCYADFTLPTGLYNWAQTAKINSLYECGLPLNQRAPHRVGRDLEVGRAPRVFPLMMQGPLVTHRGGRRGLRIDNASLVGSNPPSVARLALWKRAAIAVQGRPDWLFIKLHCHSMDATHERAVLGDGMKTFLRELVTGAAERGETLHFVSGREMVNIALAACDGREGNPGEYRDYRLKPVREASAGNRAAQNSQVVLKG